MRYLKKTIKNHHVETYCLIALPLTWIVMTGFYKHSFLSTFSESGLELIKWSFFNGGKALFWGLLPLYLYFYFKLFVGFAGWVSRTVFNDTTIPKIKIKTFIFSFFYLFCALGITNLALVLSLRQMSDMSSHASMIHASELYLSMGKYLFGVSPELWIQKLSTNHLLDYLLIVSYCNLSFLIGIVFLGSLLFNKKNFRKLILAFYIAPILGMPLWYLLPAVSPNDMYRVNMFSLTSVSPTQQQFQEAVTGEKLKTFLTFIDQKEKKPPEISTNPSMHVAWGVIITFYAIALWRPLGFLFIPWLILNIVSTVYTMQHYVVDLPPGILCAAIAIIISHYLLKIEDTYYRGTYPTFYFIHVIQSDMQALNTTLARQWFNIRNRLVPARKKYQATE